MIFNGINKIEIGSENILNKLNKYSKALSISENKYIKYRSSLINTYIESRKSMRDFSWFLKRLNYKSFFMILNSKRNAKKYYHSLKKHLNI